MDPQGGGAWPTPTRSQALGHMDAPHPAPGRRETTDEHMGTRQAMDKLDTFGAELMVESVWAE